MGEKKERKKIKINKNVQEKCAVKNCVCVCHVLEILVKNVVMMSATEEQMPTAINLQTQSHGTY